MKVVHSLMFSHQPKIAMEAPPIAIRFVQNRDSFFLCRRCRNHVLSLESCLYIMANSEAIICCNPVNVWVDNILLRMYINHQPVLNVCCSACNVNLGQEFVTVTPDNNIIQEGRFIFYLNKLLFWNGTRLVYADTNMPVLDNN